jgi:flagellar motor switch protein FliG
MAEGLREAAEELGDVRPKEAELAMGAVVRVIRDLADSGEIRLTLPTEDDD